MIRRAKVLHRTYTPEYLIEIAKRIHAERAAWKSALGLPQGSKIPEKPMPTTREELEAELAEVTAKLEEVTAARLDDPPASQELPHRGLLRRGDRCRPIMPVPFPRGTQPSIDCRP